MNILNSRYILHQLEELTNQMRECLCLDEFFRMNEVVNKTITTDYQSIINNIAKLIKIIQEWGDKDVVGRDDYDKLKGDNQITKNIFKRYEAQAIFLCQMIILFTQNHSNEENYDKYLQKCIELRDALMSQLSISVKSWMRRNNGFDNAQKNDRPYEEYDEPIYLTHFWDDTSKVTPEDFDPDTYMTLAHRQDIIKKAHEVSSPRVAA